MTLPAKFQFRDHFYSLSPPWLTTDNAEKYMYTMQLCTDLLLEKAFQAMTIRLPGQGDASQIPFLANDRALIQGPKEPNSGFVERLKQAFAAWGLAGSPIAVLGQLQAYMQGLQPGVPATYPEMTIVNGAIFPNSMVTYAQWYQFYQGDPIGAEPTLTRKASNFNWDDDLGKRWRAWLILFMYAVATGLAGTAAQTTTASGGSFTSPGHNVSGVWVPQTSGTPVNSPFLTLTGLSGLTSSVVGQWITISGSSNPTNNGTFQIAQYISGTSAVVVNVNGVTSDAGPLTWSIAAYPFIGPGPAWGTPNVVWGQGELTIPAVDTGKNFGGVWQPTIGISQGTGTTISWGLNCLPDTIIIIRQIVKAWKSAGTYYPNIIVAFDGGDGTAGSAYSPNSARGSGNPNGAFASHGANVAGVWVPTGLINSSFDAYCQGTGAWQQCSVPNIT